MCIRGGVRVCACCRGLYLFVMIIVIDIAWHYQRLISLDTRKEFEIMIRMHMV